MLTPKRTKYRRPHRVSYEGKAKGGSTIAFGDYGLQSLEGSWITSRQIEASRVAMTFYETSRESMDSYLPTYG